jgi:hypothetical protein
MGALRSGTLVLLMWVMVSGCSNDFGDRQEIEGLVTLKNQPLDDGSIEFTPLEPPPGKPETQSGAQITGGKYSIPRAQGLVPGKYRVRITAAAPETPLSAGELPGPGGPPAKERIPPEYNVNSKQEVTVTSGPNTFNFDIP